MTYLSSIKVENLGENDLLYCYADGGVIASVRKDEKMGSWVISWAEGGIERSPTKYSAFLRVRAALL